MGYKINWQKWSKKLEKLNTGLMLLWIRPRIPKLNKYVRWSRGWQLACLCFSSLGKWGTLLLTTTSHGRTFSWVSPPSSCRSQMVCLMLGMDTALRETILKDRASGFLLPCFRSKIKYVVRAETIGPCSIADALVNDEKLWQRQKENYVWVSYFHYPFSFLG